jgi:hypothetical protein
MVYLNRFNKPVAALADYFNLVSPIDKEFGNEVGTSIQRLVKGSNNVLISKLNTQKNHEQEIVLLECGAINENTDLIQSNEWKVQARETHRPISDFFEAIITDQLRKEL